MDQNLKYILDFAAGKYSYDEFEALFNLHPEIWDRVQALLTQEMIGDPAHPVWDWTLRSRLEPNGFAVRAACLAFGYDQFGQSVTWNMISRLVRFHFPDAKIREPVEESGGDLMGRLGLEDLGGPQVDDLIREIVEECRDVRPAKERNKLLKQKLKEAFHVKPRKKPYWAQEPEWPMGENSPMEFVSKEQEGDLVRYHFRDVDTCAERIVEQYY
ncbi:MAG: hypothetical protein IJX04_06055 [Oscillospiraceae bacterium]|nr:hypothetical protein [Oscillospiraceae bacterium]